MTQIIIVAAVALLALAVGWYVQQRAPDVPTAPHHTVPDQVDRADFVRPEAPWLVAVFTSATCSTCAKVWQATEPLESTDVAIQNVEVAASADLHDRYAITAVPAVIMVDSAGVTRASFLGPPTAADMWAKLAEIRAEDEAVS